MNHTIPALPYSYHALEPYIDARTMEIHYTKHHQAYLTKFLVGLEEYPVYKGDTCIELFKKMHTLPAPFAQVVRTQAGGYHNHMLFWEEMTPGGAPLAADSALHVALIEEFGSLERFMDFFSSQAVALFGSGWTWLALNSAKKLVVINTPNQESPYMHNSIPLLGLDVWEHAYYLHYQNRRAEYVKAWWHVVAWPVVAQRYNAARSSLA